MQYKLYTYDLETRDGSLIGPDRHFDLFQRSIGYDASNRLARYRGRADSILMEVRRVGPDFTGRIGRHATERAVVEYDTSTDEAREVVRDDNDYPHTLFICFPRLGMIAVKEGGSPPADSALQRLHTILIYRQSATFTFRALKAPIDLRKAVERFRVIEVSFEILPVNPHTGRLGRLLNIGRARDHIKTINGKAQSTEADPMQLNDGFLSGVQQLQQSGHARAGFKGRTEDGVLVNAPKPRDASALPENEEAQGEEVDVRLSVDEKVEYPFSQAHVTHIRTAARRLRNE